MNETVALSRARLLDASGDGERNPLERGGDGEGMEEPVEGVEDLKGPGTDKLRVPTASAQFTPIGEVVSVEPLAPNYLERARQGSLGDDGLGDFLDSLRDEGSSALSSHQWGTQ